MKKRFRALIAGVLIGALATGGAVFAKQATETISVIYDNIKILIDGKEYQPTDANGNAVEPFVYNGTTYLPVRAIANAFDKEVEWEPQTSTVVLGTKNYDWLDQMGFVDYKTTGTKNTFSAIAEGTETSDGKNQSRGMRFYLTDDRDNGAKENEDGTWECYQNISYLLNGNYKTFEGAVSYVKEDISKLSSQIKFYGDGELIYASPVLSQGMQTAPFNVNVENIKLLKIHVEIVNPQGLNSYELPRSHPCITDARLSKK